MPWQGIKVHLKEVYCELAVGIVELIFVLAKIFPEVFFINFIEVVEIIGAFGVHAFVDDKVFPLLLVGECIATVGASQGVEFGKAVVVRGEVGITDFALDLSLSPVVAVEVGLWGVTGETRAILRDIAFLTPGNGLDFLMVSVFKVGDEELPVPIILVELYFGESIYFELLVLWRV